MKNLLLTLTLFFTCFNLYSSVNDFYYTDPLPGAEYVNKGTTIILYPKEILSKKSLLNYHAFTLTGSASGSISYSITKSDDGKVIILKPSKNFQNGETVTIRFTSSVKKSNSVSITPFEYSFTVSQTDLPFEPMLGLKNEIPQALFERMQHNPVSDYKTDGYAAFPQITVTVSNNPAPGLIFLSNIVFNTLIPNTPHLLILNNNGTPDFFRQMNAQIFDFNRQPDKNYTYFSREGNKYYELDTNYILIDSFYTGNGYFTDLHELRVLPGKHALLMSYDKQVIDMSLLIQGGNTAALVTGLIIQEIDANKNVVFQWRSWDHIPITDATKENLLASEIDYIHGNAIELDNDGNLMLSSRHLDEITKINRSTGNIIWRLGGKKNMFAFINDPDRFSYQHGIRRLTNGNIMLFDNGNYHTPKFSRAVEYNLNEVNNTATLVWQYRNTPDIYGSSMGFAQRLDNGNTLISWGSTNPTLTEVKPDGTKALQINFSTGVFSYRCFKYDKSLNPVSSNNEGQEIPGKYSLSQNYPNPFNPVTKIKFQMPKQGFAVLKIYDALGREIQTLINQSLSPGTYEVDWDGNNLAGGVYFYKLTSGAFTETRKMILVK